MRSTGITSAQINAATGTVNMGGHYLDTASQPAIATADMFDKLRHLLPEVPERIERLVAERTGIEWTDYLKRPATGNHARGLGVGASGPAGRAGGGERRDIPATDAARQWEGWGTALKPAFEPVTLARKPLSGTVAANVLEHGTGALNIDATRIGGPSGRWPANVVLDESQAEELDRQSGTRKSSGVYEGDGSRNEGHRSTSFAGGHRPNAMYADTGGASRFFYVTGRQGGIVGPCDPANTAAPSSSQPSDPVGTAPGGAATSASHGGPSMSPGSSAPSTSATPTGSRLSDASSTQTTPPIDSASSPAWQPAAPSPSGSPASSVASPESATMRTTSSPSSSSGTADDTTSSGTSSSTVPGAQGFPGDELDARFKYVPKAPKSERPVVDGVAHSTVKPVTLMKWLVRMVTPPGGVVLDPFAGSGTTLEAAMLEGFNVVGIEREADYLPLIQARIERATAALAAQAEAEGDALFPIDGAAS